MNVAPAPFTVISLEVVSPMWDDRKRSRFEELRERQRQLVLTEAEEAELSVLVRELETAEGAYLHAATARLRQERETLEAQNRVLEGLARRKEALVVRLRSFLSEVQAERLAIEHELAAVLPANQLSKADE
jgi:hypothetical protein